MSYFEAVLLGLLQGLTEFLPVSSSGHLVIAQYFGGVKQPGVTFEVMLHFGTLLSIIWVFWSDISAIIFNFFLPLQRKFVFLILAGMVPTGLMGFFLGNFFRGLFEQPLVAGLMLLVTGTLVLYINKAGITPRSKGISSMGYLDAIVIGFFQGLAIIPGISRSGSTIFGALFRDLNRETAVRYSFLLAIPAIAGAAFLELLELLESGGAEIYFSPYLVATLISFASGVFAIKTFIKFLAQGKFYYFAFYCWILGISTVTLTIF